jgi:hypothetical protein
MRLKTLPILLSLCAGPLLSEGQDPPARTSSPFADCPVQTMFNFSPAQQLMLRARNIGSKTASAFDLEVELASPTLVLTDRKSKSRLNYFHLQQKLAAGEQKQISLALSGSQDTIRSVRVTHVEFMDGSSITATCPGMPFGLRYLGSH